MRGITAFLSLALAIPAVAQVSYPETRRSDFVETIFGHEIADPYRWLEDADGAETKAWVASQNRVTSRYLDSIPERKAIGKRFGELYNFAKFGVPFKVGGRYFWTENTGLQNQDVWFWSSRLGGSKKVLIDPNKLSKDGTVALSGMQPSWDGRMVAYSLSKGGSDWQEWRVRNVDTGKDLPDVIQWSKFSGAAWDKNNRGFYYSAYDAPKQGGALQEQNYFQKVYFHRLGTKQSQDSLFHQDKQNKEWGFGASTTEDGRYAVISVWKGTNRENQIYYKDLFDRSLIVRPLITGFDAQYTFIGNVGGKFYFYTDKGAPMGKVVAMELGRSPKSLSTVVPQAKEKLNSASMVGGKIFASYLKDAYTKVRVHAHSGKFQKDVSLPGIGDASGFGGLSTDDETFYTYASFGYPPTIFRYDIDSGRSSKLFQPKVKFDPNAFETKQVFYPSKDGTRIPMFLTYKKGLKLNGQNPTLLYGYGGFNVPMTPFFSPSRLVWMEMGGVSAVACIRGGNEYGNKWNDDGRLFKKQNCFDDFIAAGEWLIKQKYTSTPKLAIQGGSNGGLLVGACLNQRPDLFGAALPEVGVMDMLRFHKFTIGWAWKSDYGDPEKKEDFEYLLGYSPLHNVKQGTSYPPTLVITGDHDDRVVPAHSFKYAAALQWAQAGDSPVLIRIETQAGHGAGKPTAKIIEEIADKWAFLVKSLGVKLPNRFGK